MLYFIEIEYFAHRLSILMLVRVARKMDCDTRKIFWRVLSRRNFRIYIIYFAFEILSLFFYI